MIIVRMYGSIRQRMNGYCDEMICRAADNIKVDANGHGKGLRPDERRPGQGRLFCHGAELRQKGVGLLGVHLAGG